MGYEPGIQGMRASRPYVDLGFEVETTHLLCF